MPLPQSTAAQLREALQPLWRRLNADRTISIGKIGILGYLEKNGSTTGSTLAATQKISPQAIASAVREMEDLELLVRTPDEHDRRRIWIDITDAGRTRLAKERAVGTDWLHGAIAERLSPEEEKTLEALIPILHKLVTDDRLN